MRCPAFPNSTCRHLPECRKVGRRQGESNPGFSHVSAYTTIQARCVPLLFFKGPDLRLRHDRSLIRAVQSAVLMMRCKCGTHVGKPSTEAHGLLDGDCLAPGHEMPTDLVETTGLEAHSHRAVPVLLHDLIRMEEKR